MPSRRIQENEPVKWEPNQEKLIARYAESLVGILNISNGGLVETTQLFELEVNLRILAGNLTICGISDLETKYWLIKKTAFSWFKKCEQKDVFTFRRALAAEVRRHLSRPLSQYWILLPLHVAPGELGNARSISILGKKLLFRDWDYARRHLELETYLEKSSDHLPRRCTQMTEAFSPVFVLSAGKDFREALYEAKRSLDILRWLFNLRYQFGKMTIQWGGYPRPLARILPAPTYGVFTEDGAYQELFYILTRYEEYPRNTLSENELLGVRRLANRLKQPKSDDETMALLIEAIEKYGEALDAFEWRTAFLVLWQILELVALQSSQNLNMKKVKNRIINLLNQDPITKDLLSALYRTRNSLVHRGAFPAEQGFREVNLLKYIVERTINALFSLLRVCPNKASLQRYYEHTSTNDVELADRQRLIEYIRQRRVRNQT